MGNSITALSTATAGLPPLALGEVWSYEYESGSVDNINWLRDHLGNDSVLYSQRILVEHGGSQVLDWDTGEMYDNIEETQSINWNSRQLYDSSSATSIDWENFQLFNGYSYASGGNILGEVIHQSSATSGTITVTAQISSSVYLFLTGTTAATLIIDFTAALNSLPIGGTIGITSTSGVTELTLTTGYTALGTAVESLTAGQTVEWRKMSEAVIARRV
jgi:hypothetical protein